MSEGLATETYFQVFGGDLSHPRASLNCGARDMGSDHQIIQGKHGMIAWQGLRICYVERRASDPSCGKSFGESLMVECSSTTNVDEVGALLHECEFLFADHVSSALGDG